MEYKCVIKAIENALKLNILKECKGSISVGELFKDEEMLSINALKMRLLSEPEIFERLEEQIKLIESRKNFLERIGFEYQGFQKEELDEKLSVTWLVFDKEAKFVCLKTCGPGCEFSKPYSSVKSDTNTLVYWLERQNLYAHCLEHFMSINYAVFFEYTLFQQLQMLGWEVEEDRDILKEQYCIA